MKIEEIREPEVMFQDLNDGVVFRLNGVYFMRTDDIYNEEGDRYNCVRLANGSFEDLDIYTMVEIVNAKLIIE